MKSKVHVGRLLACVALVGAALLFTHSLAKAPSSGGGTAEAGDADVDFDFSRMNQTMRTTYTYRLGANPKEFEGKTLRISGLLLTRVDEKDRKRYFGCLIGNPGGCSCCAPGGVLEFEPKGSYCWPEDFPSVEGRITVSGLLKLVKIEDDGQSYSVPRLLEADILSH